MTEYVYATDEHKGHWLTGEEIVRCRDCKYADISYTHAAVTGELHCYGYLFESWDWYNDMPSDGVKVKPDGFCAWAERRIDE